MKQSIQSIQLTTNFQYYNGDDNNNNWNIEKIFCLTAIETSINLFCL